jgi:hypothetical protein
MADPIIDALDNLPELSDGRTHRIVELFAAQPEVLDAIKRARSRGRSYEAIAATLSANGHRISATSIRNWLRSEGIQ